MTRTLADMTPAERAACVGMWASDGDGLGIIGKIYDSGTAQLIFPDTYQTGGRPLHAVTPRLDLPRAWTPDGEPPAGEWDDDQGKNLMRRWVSDWEWKHDTPQHIRDEHATQEKK